VSRQKSRGLPIGTGSREREPPGCDANGARRCMQPVGAVDRQVDVLVRYAAFLPRPSSSSRSHAAASTSKATSQSNKALRHWAPSSTQDADLEPQPQPQPQRREKEKDQGLFQGVLSKATPSRQRAMTRRLVPCEIRDPAEPASHQQTDHRESTVLPKFSQPATGKILYGPHIRLLGPR